MPLLTITKRPKAKGDFSYRCAIVVKKNNQIIHGESKKFRKKENNQLWAYALGTFFALLGKLGEFYKERKYTYY